MFNSARLKLTAWYLLIIMAVSVMFSAIIYTRIDGELERFEHREQLRRIFLKNNGLNINIMPGESEGGNDILASARIRILSTLGVINISILLLAGGAGYFLAGRTLKPIKEMMDEQSRFVTDASHELRTPLTSLKTTLEVSLRNNNLSAKDTRSILQSNLEDVNSLQILTDELIHLAQFQKTINKLTLESFDLAEAVSVAFEKVKVQARVKNIKINFPKKTLYVVGDKKSIAELFVIFLDNAIKYSHEKSMIGIDYKVRGSNVVIEIQDKGIGIDKEHLDLIFNRFYRVEESRSKDDAKGYGLGLSIAKKIVELHNGEINVKSEKNKGTTFYISLPIVKNVEKVKETT